MKAISTLPKFIVDSQPQNRVYKQKLEMLKTDNLLSGYPFTGY